MAAAGIKGPQATAKGLRHGFAVACVLVEPPVPLNVIQRWMGYTHICTTAIYLQVVGEEERRLAARLWGGLMMGILAQRPKRCISAIERQHKDKIIY